MLSSLYVLMGREKEREEWKGKLKLGARFRKGLPKQGVGSGNQLGNWGEMGISEGNWGEN